jgi:sulfofructose kinase
LGLCVVDHTYRVDSFDPGQIRIGFSARRVSSGGMTGTALCQAAVLGCDARALSVVGDDADGRFVRRELRGAGVKTRSLLLSRHAPTTLAVVLVDPRGERRFLVPDRRGIEARAPALDLSTIGAGTVLLLDGHFPSQALRAAKLARARGGTVVGDFHRLHPGVRRLLPYVDHAIVPMEFVEAAGYGDPRRALHELAELSGGRPVVTQGRRGGLYLDGRRVRRFRAQRVRVVDSTGAGDVFHGAFAAGLAYGLSFESCLDLAARAAAKNCTALGGAGRFMTRGELPRAMRRAVG